MRRFLAKFAAVAAAPLLAATLGTGTAHADTSSVWGEVRFANGYCLDVAGANFVSGATVQIWGCNGTQAQQWSLYPADATHFLIQAATSNDHVHTLCANNWEGGDVTGNHMRLYPCTQGSANDTWFNWVHKGNGRQIQPKVASANCLNSWGGLYQGAQARLYPCLDSAEENVVSAPIFPS
ncbi:ricin-type beta-trefoil lectin domain protein [Kitasatospora sp. NPDC028055]|uniref:RICIN domain-containing protein n=1 Tax=Kitasatospora sp. NPDC028055 TaxID=3155653 RepID=UPI0033E11756